MSDHANGSGLPSPAQGTSSGEGAAVGWHLAEVAAIMRGQSRPLDPALLRVVLRGMSELCRLLFERGQEAPTEAPYLFRNDPVVSEALSMWERRVRTAMSEEQATARAAR